MYFVVNIDSDVSVDVVDVDDGLNIYVDDDVDVNVVVWGVDARCC